MSEYSKFTLLVIEDDEMLREFVVGELTSAGFNVITAKNGQEALTIMRDHSVHAVLADVLMSGKSGIDVLHEIRSVESVNVPFVFMSGANDPEVMRRALQLGAVDFLTKPFDMDQAVKTLGRIAELGATERRAIEALDALKKIPEAASATETLEKAIFKARLLRLSHYKNQGK